MGERLRWRSKNASDFMNEETSYVFNDKKVDMDGAIMRGKI
jgi:hypothetical protein